MGGRSEFPPASWTAYSGSELQQSTDTACGRVSPPAAQFTCCGIAAAVDCCSLLPL